tara:strand:+ start:519 stop:980 length:462 start_codon:yes stop_codon:yes gene_type:complete
MNYHPSPNGLTQTETELVNRNPATEYLLMEAAMCAWECLLETHREKGFEDFGGAANARYLCSKLAPAIHYGYVIANKDDALAGWSYDWDFVPWFMDRCVIFTPQGVDLTPDWVNHCRELNPHPTAEDLLSEALPHITHSPLRTRIEEHLQNAE